MNNLRAVALAPTYNNAGTLGSVIDDLRACGMPVIVVDDGSTDATPSILTRQTDVIVVRHDVNRGKAAALHTGFSEALKNGYTHILTFDTDGQHDARDIAALLERAERYPDALILGARATSINGYPLANRVGRSLSNFLVRLNSGVQVSDSQCGLRVYPLDVAVLPARAARYGFETEIIVRCGWARVPVIETPVHCVYEMATGRVSHFRPWRDSVTAVGMHSRLFVRSLFPAPKCVTASRDSKVETGTIIERLACWLSPRRAWQAVRHDVKERQRFAAALSVGVFVANLPVYGLQSLISLVLARRLRLHPLAVLAGSHFSIPPIGPALIALAISVGHLLLHGTFATVDEFDPSRAGYLDLLRHVAVEWTIGSMVCGLTFATLTFLVTQFLIRAVFSGVPLRNETTTGTV